MDYESIFLLPLPYATCQPHRPSLAVLAGSGTAVFRVCVNQAIVLPRLRVLKWFVVRLERFGAGLPCLPAHELTTLL